MNRKLSTVIIVLCFLLATSSVAFAKKGDNDKDKDSDKGKKGLRHIVNTLQQEIADLKTQIANIPAGVDGINGTNGTDGTNGIDGAVGPQGPAGPAGPPGADSTVAGPPGENGADGAEGQQGLAGIDGIDGVDGAEGPQGPQGEQGVAGLDGAPGADGQVGFQGPPGETGPQGEQGPAGTPKVTYVTGHDIPDGRDSGFVNGRTLNFVKDSSSSELRVLYSDNLRVSTTDTNAFWMIYLDGSPTDIRTRLHNTTVFSTAGVNRAGVDSHRQSTLVGFLAGIPAGSHTIQVHIEPGLGADAYTGWNSTFLLQVEEIEQ